VAGKSRSHSSPQEEPERSACQERRAFVRYACDLPAACQSGAGGWLGHVTDLSAGGLGLLLRHRFRPGTPLRLELRLADGTRVRGLAVRVVHAKPSRMEGEAGWHLGCVFPTPLSDDELQRLVK
jgi:hypothetical protein